MASIRKRGKGYSVVYSYVDESGNKKQKWESFKSHKEALQRKAEVENQIHSGSFVSPNTQTIREFMNDFVRSYGEKRWSLSMYEVSCAMIENYINPIIGDLSVQSITPKTVDQYIQTLQETKPVIRKNRQARTDYITASTIEKIIKLLKCAFKQAIRWEMINRNPFDNCILPKKEVKKRDIWTKEQIMKALDNCTDSKLYIAINLSFACSLRVGEILGLTWDNVHISEKSIANDDAYITVCKELRRVSLRAMEILKDKDIYHVFPPVMNDTTTRLVLKKPKTDSSIRKIWLPKTVAYILLEWKKAQDSLKRLLGEEYQDYNLVVTLDNGRPCENRILQKSFKSLREKVGLPKVCFHSLRHSSTTYKLKLNKGDVKATQGDTGHSQADMVTDVYAHIIDEDRKINAQKFETAFYSNPDLREVKAPNVTEQNTNMDLIKLMEEIKKSPELKETLRSILNG